MKKFFIFLIVMLFSSAMWAQNNFIHQKYIKDKDKPVLVMFTATWCGPCNMMKNKVFKEDQVKAKLEDYNFLIFDIDTESSKPYMEIFRKSGHFKGSIPCFILMDKDQNIIATQLGSSPAQTFLAFLAKADGE